MAQVKTYNPSKIRNLLGNERKFLWSPVANVAISARIEGNISEDRLKNAINRLKGRHQLLSSRAVYNETGEAWFSGDNVPEIPLRVVQRESDYHWLKELMAEHHKPFDIFKGPLIRFTLIKSPEISDFLVFCQHSICDGTGLSYLIRDILSHTADPDLEITPLPLPPLLSPGDLASYVRGGFKRSMKNFFIKKMNAKWRKNMTSFDQEDFENIHKAYWQKHNYRIVFMELSEGQTKNLVTRCRQKLITVNSALCTAFLAAHGKIAGPFKGQKRNVAIPVDLRNRMKNPVGDVLCLYVGSMMLKFDYNNKKGFWQNTKRFHQRIKNDMESKNLFETFIDLESMDHTLMDAMLGFGILAGDVPKSFSKYEKLSSFASKKNNMAVSFGKKFSASIPGLVMTNLGKVNIPDTFGNLKVDKMFFAPSTSEYFPLALGVITAGGKLTLTINFVDEAITERMVQIRDCAMDILGI